MLTDGELLQRYVTDHSESAFAELVRRHLALVYSTALRQLGGDAHCAQDVTQTVFTDLARKAAKLRDRPALAGWLFLGAHHAAAQIVRTNRRRQIREQEDLAMQQLLASSTPPTDWDRVRPVLDDTLRDLDETDREAVLLRFFQQRPFADIGAALNLSENAARMRVERALDKLHALLGRRGINSTTAALATVCANQAMVAAPAGLAASVTGAVMTATTVVGGGTTAASFLMTKTTLTLSAAVLAAALLGFREFNQRRTAEALNLTQQAELARLRTHASTADQHLAAAERESATIRSELQTLRAAPAASASTSNAPQPAQGQFFLAPDPMAPVRPPPRGTTLAEAFSSLYTPLYRQLGLTSEQQDQFTAILVADKERRDALFNESISAGLKPSGTLLGEVMKRTEPQRDIELREALGEATLQSFQRFEALAPLRSATDELASTLFRSGAPLSPAQADQLVTIMAANMPTPGGGIDLAAMNTETVLLQARSILLPEQVRPFQRALESAQAAARMRRERK